MIVLPILGQSKLDEKAFRALYKGDNAKLTKLLDKGVNVNASFGSTTLLEKSLHLGSGMYKELIKRGAKCNRQNENNLLIATRSYHKLGIVNIAKVLLECGASIDGADREGKTPLYIAVVKNNLELVKLYLESGANPNHVTKDGISIHYASRLYANLKVINLINEARGGETNYKKIEVGMSGYDFIVARSFPLYAKKPVSGVLQQKLSNHQLLLLIELFKDLDAKFPNTRLPNPLYGADGKGYKFLDNVLIRIDAY